MKHTISTLVVDIDSGNIEIKFDRKELNSYLNVFGDKGKDELIKNLALMQYDVLDTWLNRDKEESDRIEVDII